MRAAACVSALAASLLLVHLLASRRRRRHRSTAESGLLFTGTGCSSGLPLIGCAIGAPQSPKKSCTACGPALRNGRADKNWRNNVGALLRFRGADGQTKHVQIDCGKTFRDTCLRVYSEHGVTWLDALLLTHDHADAVFGLDELRSLQPVEPGTFRILSSITCFCDRRTLTRMRHAFPYLFKKRAAAPLRLNFADLCQCCELDLEPLPARPGTLAPVPGGPADGPAVSIAAAAVIAAAPAAASSSGGAPRQMAVAGGGSLDGAAAPPPAPAVRRFVASIEWVSFGDAFEVAELDVVGLAVTALPVLHGADYTCYGFAFGPPQERVVYLSDYTALLPQTDALLASWSSGGEAIHLLVLDALRAEGSHPVHATLSESVELARRLRPRRTLLVGMGHALEHHATNRRLRRLWREEQLDVQLAFDGMFVPLPGLDVG
mmetsp:Transcript_25731/g.76012  ORF Transcript_25731/g.76012 Transcript_25731/m.76012 type:complete len:433 (-) Transcript_25731:1258-2556(-)